jgi:hypothetical protein
MDRIVISDDKFVSQYQRTLQRSVLLLPPKLDWWWKHHTWEIHNRAVPPEIERRVVLEHKSPERPHFF